MTDALYRIITIHGTNDYTHPDNAHEAATVADENGTLTAMQRYNPFTGQWDEWEHQ